MLHYSKFAMETASLSFIEADSFSYTFTQTYNKEPVVVVSSTADIDVFVDMITKTYAIIGASQKGTYTVYIRVIEDPQS